MRHPKYIFKTKLIFQTLALFTADHLIGQQETKARMLMKQNVNWRRKGLSITNNYFIVGS